MDKKPSSCIKRKNKGFRQSDFFLRRLKVKIIRVTILNKQA